MWRSPDLEIHLKQLLGISLESTFGFTLTMSQAYRVFARHSASAWGTSDRAAQAKTSSASSALARPMSRAAITASVPMTTESASFNITSTSTGGNKIMSSNAFVITSDQQVPPLNVVGMQIRVLASNVATQSYGITLQQGDEGSGPPPHKHGWDEAFYVLKGEVNFQCDGKSSVCSVGTLVHVPRGTVHGFSFGRGGGQMLEISGAGANAAPFFRAIHDEIPAGPPNIPKLLELAAKHGVEFAI